MSDTPAWASRSPDTIRRWRSAVTAGWRPPSRRRSACATSGQPPLATMPSNCAIACSVCCTVAGDSVGSDAFGIWMVREPESKPWPKSLLWFWSISAWSAASWPKAREAATPPPASAVACARRRSTARRLGWRWSGDLVMDCPRSPKGPRILLPDAFSRSQTARARQVPELQICGRGKGGAGRICDEFRDALKHRTATNGRVTTQRNEWSGIRPAIGPASYGS